MYPAEGRGNLGSLLDQAEAFLNTDEDGVAAPFADLDPSSSDYDLRLRSVLGMLMMSPRFQEQ